jgi:LysM repeat protein
MTTVTLRRGDTLSGLSRRYGVSARTIARANGITNPRTLQIGQRVTIPDGFDRPGARRTGRPAARPSARRDERVAPPRSERRASPPAVSSVRAGNRQFPASADGTPMFRQGDPEWGQRRLGNRYTISQSGCAMTAAAMAISRTSGRTVTPGQMDQYLDRNRGYSGDALNWDAAARSAGLRASRPGWSLDSINRSIDAGRPVVVGVDYKQGSRGGANGTDHWVTITGRQRDQNGRSVYTANDPATGRQFRFYEQGGRLVSDYQARNGRNYRTTGQQVQFS